MFLVCRSSFWNIFLDREESENFEIKTTFSRRNAKRLHKNSLQLQPTEPIHISKRLKGSAFKTDSSQWLLKKRLCKQERTLQVMIRLRKNWPARKLDTTWPDFVFNQKWRSEGWFFSKVRQTFQLRKKPNQTTLVLKPRVSRDIFDVRRPVSTCPNYFSVPIWIHFASRTFSLVELFWNNFDTSNLIPSSDIPVPEPDRPTNRPNSLTRTQDAWLHFDDSSWSIWENKRIAASQVSINKQASCSKWAGAKQDGCCYCYCNCIAN